jgi:hypothetical protein
MDSLKFLQDSNDARAFIVGGLFFQNIQANNTLMTKNACLWYDIHRSWMSVTHLKQYMIKAAPWQNQHTAFATSMGPD